MHLNSTINATHFQLIIGMCHLAVWKSANEAKVRVLISISSNALNERDLLLQLPQIKALSHTNWLLAVRVWWWEAR